MFFPSEKQSKFMKRAKTILKKLLYPPKRWYAGSADSFCRADLYLCERKTREFAGILYLFYVGILSCYFNLHGAEAVRENKEACP